MPDTAALRDLFIEANYVFVDPPIVYPAGVFVELAGEDLRRRLYLTSSDDGAELALRPDFTIPVCLAHLATGPANRKANYAYMGPVFRIRGAGQPGEFLQAGVESLGRTDRVAADADILKLAFAAADALGAGHASVRVGDSALFAAILDSLDLTPPWRKRFGRAFGDTPRLAALISRANGKQTVSADAGTSRAKLRASIAERLATASLATVGGRTADEIADRVIEKAALSEGIGRRAAETLSAFLGIAGPPETALAEIRSLATDEKLDIAKAADRFEKRTAAFASHGIDTARLTFAADFGRRLDYYTGFVFEFRGGNDLPGPIVGGGRYDRMMAHLGRTDSGMGEAVPAVGFAIWLDRIGGAS